MKLRITDTDQEFRVAVIDDAGCVIVDEATRQLVEYCPYQLFPTEFKHKGEWYRVVAPYFLSSDWKIYKIGRGRAC
jgi:hypothetical protein